MKTPTTPSQSSNLNTTVAISSKSTDGELMCAIQDRDDAALEILFQRYRELLKSVILRIVHDHAAADDVLQDCMLEIWNHADHFSPLKGEPLGWIVTLSKRRAIDSLRRTVAYSNACDRLETETRLKPLLTDAGEDCEQADIGRVLREHLSLLPELQQEVISLAFLEGMSQREVAKATDTPLGTVKTRLELGLRKLRAAFRTRNAIYSMQHA